MTRSLASRRSPRLALAALAGLAVPFSAVHAQTLNWNNAAGGSAGTAGNWNPAGVPAAGSILNFNLAGNYAVSFPATVPICAQQNFNVGTISLSSLVPHTATQQFVVGLGAGSTPAVTFTGGSLSSGVISVGGNPTSTASLTITGPTANMFSTGAAGARLGNTGNGTVTIADGGSLRSTNLVNIGSAAGSRGAVTVTGTNHAIRSELVTLDAVGGTLNVGVLGAGTLTVASGGLVDVAASGFIAPNAGVTGSVTVGSGIVNIAGDLHIGQNTTAAGAGTGTLTANSGASIAVAGSTVVGDSAGGTGTMTVQDGAVFSTGSLTIEDTHGVLNHFGGFIRVTDGVLHVPNNQLVMNGGSPTANPILSLSNSSATLTAPAGSRALTVGTTRSCVFDVASNGLLNVSSGEVVLGDLAGSEGWLQVQTGGDVSIANAGMLTIGNNGDGRLVASANGSVTCGSVQAGVGGTGVGVIEVVNLSSLDITGTLALGGTLSAAGGTASMTIGSGSTVRVGGVVIPQGTNMRVHAGSSLTINSGGTLVSDQVVRCTGALTLAGGTIDASNVVTGPVGPYSLTGVITGLFQPQGAVPVNLTGPLTVGALRNDSTINVGDHTFVVVDNAFDLVWFLGNCTVGALGHVVAPDGLQLLAGKVLSGDGTVDADLQNAGTITATGGGLTLNGMVTGFGEGIGGTAIEFGPAGGFIGTGNFGETEIHALAGSQITATSFLVMGKSASNAGFASEGRITVATSNPVTLKDLNGASITDVVFTDTDPDDDPSIRCTGGLTVRGLVTGTGILDAFTSAQQNNPQILRCDGATLSPGDASGAGTIHLNGNSFLTPTNRVEVDIFDATTHDQIRTLANLLFSPTIHTVPSDITLGGTLVVRVAPGHTPTSGEVHQVIATNHGFLGPDGAVIGAFSAVEAPRHWLVSVVALEGPGQENGVFAVYCPADFNEDGFLDFFDSDAFVAAFEAGEPDSDFNGDGFIDFFDADDFVLAFEAGC